MVLWPTAVFGPSLYYCESSDAKISSIDKKHVHIFNITMNSSVEHTS
ncbi:hypothetical protein ACVLD2_000300 [Paenibacillus sp. PvR052]|nr:hypothetical protein [Paenibacillus sp. PvP091]MBP1168834.1 hypothetical protein [Paenibacillus sp. PvR098]MBP2439862.1 hypothetical protein [Paenibacillus sp. PvP052]